MANLEEYITHGREERNLEYKRGEPWVVARDQIIRTALAMANLRDGGRIVVGVAQAQGGGYEPSGLDDSAGDSYSEDDVREAADSFADPTVRLDLHQVVYEGRRFVVIVVHEFELVPVIAKKEKGPHIRRGAVYTRTTKPATVEVPDASLMREILDLATAKVHRDHQDWMDRAGVPRQRSITDADRFAEQLRGL